LTAPAPKYAKIKDEEPEKVAAALRAQRNELIL
jgi:hypothetical protein